MITPYKTQEYQQLHYLSSTTRAATLIKEYIFKMENILALIKHNDVMTLQKYDLHWSQDSKRHFGHVKSNWVFLLISFKQHIAQNLKCNVPCYILLFKFCIIPRSNLWQGWCLRNESPNHAWAWGTNYSIHWMPVIIRKKHCPNELRVFKDLTFAGKHLHLLQPIWGCRSCRKHDCSFQEYQLPALSDSLDRWDTCHLHLINH